MKTIYQQIIELLSSRLGQKLDMSAQDVKFQTTKDPGLSAPGFTTEGNLETITIPDEYMRKASANSAKEFLNWLKNQ